MKVYPPLRRQIAPAWLERAREVCSNDSWIADHDFGYQIRCGVTQIFLIFLPKWPSMSGTKGKRSEQAAFSDSTA
jgi:hypothetical protein